MDRPEDIDPYPIVLPGPRPVGWGTVCVLAVATTSVLVITFMADCSRCRPPGLTLAFLGAFLTIAFTAEALRASHRRQLVIERTGFVHDGRAIPWEAVMSMGWVPDAGGEEMGEHIEMWVRSMPGFDAPRHRRVYVFHKRFGIAPNTLIDLFEGAALPRRIPILAIKPAETRAS